MVVERNTDRENPNETEKRRFFLFSFLKSLFLSQPFLHTSGEIGYGVQRWTNRGYKHTSRM